MKVCPIDVGHKCNVGFVTLEALKLSLYSLMSGLIFKLKIKHFVSGTVFTINTETL